MSPSGPSGSDWGEGLDLGQLGPAQPGEAGFGVYVHVPFCARACPYCDFDFSVQARPELGPLLRSYEAELAARSDTRPGESPRTVYIGGGTPSVFDAAQLGSLCTWISKCWPTEACEEWTVEMNPEHVDDARVEALASAGVNRVSLGVQSLDGAGLRQLGRAHTPAQAQAAIEAAHAAGLAVSADLIVGWPEQTAAGLDVELAELIATGVGHISIYALTIEAGTPWERLAERGVRKLPQANVAAAHLDQAHARLVEAGFAHYEVASYARGGAAARHNTSYWTGRDYVGIGPSAASAHFSVNGAVRRTNPRGAAWPDADPSAERLDAETRAREGLWLGLRLLEGLEISTFLARVGRDRSWLDERCARPLRQGNVEVHAGVLRVAPGRWLHHDTIAVDLL